MDIDVRAASWIAGLMRQDYDAVGFIPEPTVARQYVAQGRYILQLDERGRRVGYLLHGAPQSGHALRVAQHLIEHDKRRRGYGEAALRELIERAEAAGASCITARVATDLDALDFWMSQGFLLAGLEAGGQKRDRQIARLWLPLHLPLFSDIDVRAAACRSGVLVAGPTRRAQAAPRTTTAPWLGVVAAAPAAGRTYPPAGGTNESGPVAG